MSNLQDSSGSVVDVRSIIPREQHPLIFNTFHDLDRGPDVQRVRISRIA